MNSFPLALFTRRRLHSCRSATASMTKIKLGYVEFTPKVLTQSRGVHHEDNGGLSSDRDGSDGRGKVCRHFRYHDCSVCLPQTPARYPHLSVTYFSILVRRRTVGLSDLHPNLPKSSVRATGPALQARFTPKKFARKFSGLMVFISVHYSTPSLITCGRRWSRRFTLRNFSIFDWVDAVPFGGYPPLPARIFPK